MTDDEKRDFCRHLTTAAKTLGMKMGVWHGKDGTIYGFYDLNVVIKGEESMNLKDALVSACQALQNYFSIPWDSN